MAIEDQIREMRTAISQAASKTARAAVELDNAKERSNAARQALKEDFGVETPEDAKAKLAELQEQLDEELVAVQKALEEAGA